MESSALPFRGVCEDISLVVQRDLFTERQPDAGAGIFLPGMQPLENVEDLFRILLVETDAVI